MDDLAVRTERTGVAQFSRFLTPAELEQAHISARQAGVFLEAFGGYPGAERRVAAFLLEEEAPEEWPVVCLRVCWEDRFTASPAHRDLLGAIMALGMDRSQFGDIVVEAREAFVFALPVAAKRIVSELFKAGGTTVRVEILEEIPPMASAEGTPVQGTVSSLRLDAVMDLAFRISRGRAAELIRSGRVQVDHLLELRPDRKLGEGVMISVRGMGRAQLAQINGQTKKDRTSIMLLRYGV